MIAGHDANRAVGEPAAGHQQCEGERGTVQGAAQERSSGVAVAKGKEQDQRDPETAGEFGEGGALVGGEQGKAGEERGASGQGCGRVPQNLKRQGADGQAGRGQEQEDDGDGDQRPGENKAERRAQHPGEWRVKEEARLACAVVDSGRPVRINDAVEPVLLDVEPGDGVEFEVVAAEGAVEQDGRGGQGRGEEDEGRTEKR